MENNCQEKMNHPCIIIFKPHKAQKLLLISQGSSLVTVTDIDRHIPRLTTNHSKTHKTKTGETLNGKTETEHTLNKIPGH